MNFSSVVGYHMNPMTCGVAKFNAELAKRLGVPFVGWLSAPYTLGDQPLFSLKWSELHSGNRQALQNLCGYMGLSTTGPTPFGVFWHDVGDERISSLASVVYHADPSLGPNGLWCPSLLTPSKPRTVRLFSFGMAHKLQTAHYAKVRNLLDAAGLRYHLRVSVGLHEGTSISDATQHFDALREIMGPDNVTILGCLSDDAVAEELSNTDYVLAFFADRVRYNNTTVHAALDADALVITNGKFRDAFDINDLDAWPRYRSPYSWEQLIAQMEMIYATTTNRQPTHQR